MSAGLTSRLRRLERRHSEAAALGAEVLALLDALRADDPAAYTRLTAELLLTRPVPERT